MLHSKYESTKFHKTLGNLRQSNTLFLITDRDNEFQIDKQAA